MKGFSLLEMIIVIVLITIVISFAIPKFSNITNKANYTTLKSEFSLIQNGIREKKTKNILLSNTDEITYLDDAPVDTIGILLFDRVIDFKIISTNRTKKELAKWSKISNNLYEFYLSSSKSVLFSFENEKFICKSEEEICKEIE
uniref:prepilin-type N-terminal cleavage/methylation domain-containing protein n=1 Tax=Aliarcobacter sp. TaxID=2321116 RepID=UPI00404894D4